MLIYAAAALLFNHPGLRGMPTMQPVVAPLVAPGVPRACPRGDTVCAAGLVTAAFAALDRPLESARSAGTFELVSLDSVTSFSMMSIPVRRAGARWTVSIDLAGDSVPRVTAFPQLSPRWRDVPSSSTGGCSTRRSGNNPRRPPGPPPQPTLPAARRAAERHPCSAAPMSALPCPALATAA